MNKNKKIKIAFIFGTRPEAIKMYPVIREAQHYPSWIEPIIILTAQHREMLDQMTSLFQIYPDYDLGIMEHGQSLSQINSRTLMKLEGVLKKCQPDMVLVQGDTTTTFSGALSAFYQKIEIGHLEAGLRTQNKYYPYPEEMNRRLTTVLSDYHFAPTRHTAAILMNEGVPAENVFVTGNTVIDALFLMQKKAFQFSDHRINDLITQKAKLLLVSMHRRENWGTPIENLCNSLHQISEKHTDLKVLFLLHKNPKIREIILKSLGGKDNIFLLEALDYQEMANLMAFSTLILTDSGGIQEEAPALGKPVLILRYETERPEVVRIGAAKLIGTQQEDITKEVNRLLENKEDYHKMVSNQSPYGDGNAARRIVKYILYRYHYINDPPQEFRINNYMLDNLQNINHSS